MSSSSLKTRHSFYYLLSPAAALILPSTSPVWPYGFEVVWSNYIPHLLHYVTCYRPRAFKSVMTVLFLQWAVLPSQSDRTGLPTSLLIEHQRWQTIAVTNLQHCFHSPASTREGLLHLFGLFLCVCTSPFVPSFYALYGNSLCKWMACATL